MRRASQTHQVPPSACPQGPLVPQGQKGHQGAGGARALGHHARQAGVEGEADGGPEGHDQMQMNIDIHEVGTWMKMMR